jgi:hypothetical protein
VGFTHVENLFVSAIQLSKTWRAGSLAFKTIVNMTQLTIVLKARHEHDPCRNSQTGETSKTVQISLTKCFHAIKGSGNICQIHPSILKAFKNEELPLGFFDGTFSFSFKMSFVGLERYYVDEGLALMDGNDV